MLVSQPPITIRLSGSSHWSPSPQHLRSALCSALSLETASGSCPWQQKCHKCKLIALLLPTCKTRHHSLKLGRNLSRTLQSSSLSLMITIVTQHHLSTSITKLPLSSPSPHVPRGPSQGPTSPRHDAMLGSREIHQGDAALEVAAVDEDATEPGRWG